MKVSWWRHQMDIFSALLTICAQHSPVPGEFPAQRPMARSFDVFFDLRLNKRFSKPSWGWWFETLSHPLWRHCNVIWWRGIFLLISCLYSCFIHYPSSAYSFPLISIYSQIAFYTKYFVLTFSIDVVSPLSNMNKVLTKVLYIYMQHAIIFAHSSVFHYIVFQW